MNGPAFHVGAISHWVVLGLTVLLAGLMVAGRRHGCRWARGLELTVGWGVFISYFADTGLAAWSGLPVVWRNALPMHLCNWAAFATWVGLVWRRPLAAELAWFWGMSGTLQATLTPNQTLDFPHPTFVTFFILHGGVVAGAIHLVFGLGMRPQARAWLRAIVWTQGYVLAAAAVNLAIGSNYAFLCAKPVNPSLMDKLGPWPWYVAGLHALGVAFMVLLDMPFWRGRRPAGKPA